MMYLTTAGGRSISLERPQVMGILNATPDSFSDGGRFFNLDAALRQAQAMIEGGAAMIDIGGESTRPGAASVSVAEELERVVPLVEAIAERFDTLISVDTSTPEVMRESAAVGAGLINDVRALQRPGALAVAAELQLPVCLMHMQGQPQTMQQAPRYQDVVQDVADFLLHRAAACREAGIGDELLMFDPGFGFGKTLSHNLSLLKHLPDLAAYGYPLLVGMSRKSMIDQVLGRPVDQRLAGSLGLAAYAALYGAAVIRVHDVTETVDLVRMIEAVRQAD